ncbi:MAG: hypothetical protein PWP76_105 [Candidatus Diapherotrites archaeon]|nr:hypothetical protein [Candidatus Diapherotrites archaeon]MDN5366799.1 hypothetical protein [Candidatus Diapherotrites archaeon]
MSLRFFGEKKRKEPPRERPVFDGASEKTKMKDLLASVHKAEEQQRKLTEKEREKIHNLLDAFAGVLGAEDHRVRHDSHYYVLKMEDGYHLLRVGYRGIENQLSFRVLKLGTSA